MSPATRVYPLTSAQPENARNKNGHGISVVLHLCGSVVSVREITGLICCVTVWIASLRRSKLVSWQMKGVHC